jgi:isopenicillin N synthase-like dioxygenase
MYTTKMSTENIPIIDLSAASDGPSALSDALLQACASWGFFYVRGHSIPQQDIDECFSIVKSFFSQPEKVKNESPYIASRNAGYKAAGTYSSGNKGTASQKSDPRESYSMNKWTSEEAAASTQLPPGLDEHREVLRAFQGQCYTLGTRILECIARALDLRPSYFSAQHHREMANFDNFEIMHYPKPENGDVFTHRISPHTDWVGSVK